MTNGTSEPLLERLEAAAEKVVATRAKPEITELTLYSIINDAPDGILAVDEHGDICFANKRLTEIFGYSRFELLGKPLNILLPERLHVLHGDNFKSFSSRPGKRRMEAGLNIIGRRKDGTEIPLDIALSYAETITGILPTAFIRAIRNDEVVVPEKTA